MDKEYKVCTKCKVRKGVEEFCRSTYNTDGRAYWCRVCCSAANRAYRLKNKEEVSVKRQMQRKASANSVRERERKWYSANKESVLLRQQKHYIENKGARRASKQKYYKKHSKKILQKAKIRYQKDNRKVLANAAIKYAKQKGQVQAQSCEICGTIENVHAHHDDYGKPLMVRWLCATHHARHHAAVKTSGNNA